VALSITSDLIVITNGSDGTTLSGTFNDIGGGGGSAAEPDYFIQGSGCVSRAVSGASASRGFAVDIGAGNQLDFSSGGTEENHLIYIWIQCYTPGLADDVATAPGLRIRLGTGTGPTNNNYAEWDIIYSDLLTPAGTEFFRIYALDPRAPPTRVSGTWNSTTWNSVRHFGAALDTNATAKGQNLGIDRICHGKGELIITGTATGTTTGFEEIISGAWTTIDDSVAIGSASQSRNGILNVRGSTAFIKGKLVFGDGTGTAATTFTGTNGKYEWEDTFYYDSGGRIRSMVGYDQNQNYTGRQSDGSAYYGIEFRGNGTGATNVTFGEAVGTDQGRSGGTFRGSDITPTEFIGDDGAVEDVKIYGSTFDKFRKIDFSSNASTDLIRGCNIVDSGTFDIGPVEGRNINFINGIGGSYYFFERFINNEAISAETLSTADPTTEWTDLLNGADFSIPSASAGYVELLGGTTRTNVVLFDDEKVTTSANHYVSCIISFPSAGASQGSLGPVIAGVAGTEDYFYMDVDLLNDQVSLIRCNTGTDTTIAGPTTFTMDEDEEYVVLLRRNGTTIEGFITGTSVADGNHNVRISATDSAFSTQYITGIRGDAAAGQTGDGPRIFDLGTGPITDNLGALLYPVVTSVDFSKLNLINCRRALSFDSTGTFGIADTILSGNIVEIHNDSGGSVTASITGTGTVPEVFETTGAGTTTATASFTFDVTNIARYSEVRIIRESDDADVSGVETIDNTSIGLNNMTTSGPDSNGRYTATYTHGGTDGDVRVIVMGDPVLGDIRYQHLKSFFTLQASDDSLQVAQIIDRVFSNP
jgi:hypothetical protein